MQTGDDELLELPAEFPIKAMGRAQSGFVERVVAIVRAHAPVSDEAIRVQDSRNARFVSVTVTIRAQSRAQLDAIYNDLTACDDVLMAL